MNLGSIFSGNTRNAVTADERIDGLKIDVQVAMRRPLFGHGLGTSREANANATLRTRKIAQTHCDT